MYYEMNYLVNINYSLHSFAHSYHHILCVLLVLVAATTSLSFSY